MSDLESDLEAAESAGVLAPGQGSKLAAFLRERSASRGGATTSGEAVEALNQSKNPDFNSLEAAEVPRFVRGFHDILITIGIILALIGSSSFLSIVGVVPVAWILAEIFVKRQNLALPAVVLTVAFAFGCAGAAMVIFDSPQPVREELEASIIFAVLVAAMLLFYWRFKVPLALAGCISAAFGVSFFTLVGIMVPQGGLDAIEQGLLGWLLGGLAVFLALGLFAIAMWFDSRDIHRVTRRSDVAFWLHVSAAPALLYGLLILVLGGPPSFEGDLDMGQVMAVLIIVAVLMLVGVVIDRRVFVTSGLISLGIAIYGLSSQLGLGFSSYSAFAILLVGVIVLTIGTGWIALRRMIVAGLPEAIRSRVPPANA